MARRTLVPLMALLAVSALALLRWHARPAPVAATPTVAASATPYPRLEFTAAASRDDLEGLLAAAYRLPADRRFVAAIADLRSLVAPGARPARAGAEWVGDHWALTCERDDAGSLPELPSFSDGLQAAERWARSECARHPLPAGAPEGTTGTYLDDAMPVQALALLDRAAARAGCTGATVEQAMVACTQLALLVAEDHTDFSDTTAARALALLALTRALGRGAHQREACALAWAMGYRGESARLASALPAGDALRLFVLGPDAELDRAARAPAAGRETRFLDLLAKARADRLEDWFAAIRRADDPRDQDELPLLGTALAFRRFDMSRVIGPALLEASLADVPFAADHPEANAASLLAFERSMSRLERGGPGRLSGGAVAGVRRALFYSGMLAEHDFLDVRLGSPAAVRVMTDSLAPAAHTPAGWFVRWQADLCAAAENRAVPGALRADLEDPAIRAPFVLRTFDALVPDAGVPRASARAAARVLARRLDSRPRWALRFAIVSQATVEWPTLTERLLAHAAGGSGAEAAFAAVLHAQMLDDRAALAAIVEDPRTDPSTAARTLKAWVEADSSAAESLRPRFATLADRAPGEWHVASAYAGLLEARGRPADAERVVRRWMAAADSEQDALDSEFAVTTLSRLLRKQGRLPEALRVVTGFGEGLPQAAMVEKAIVLALSGRLDTALAYADRIRERYPEKRSTEVLPVELLWRAGRNEQAAARIATLQLGSPEVLGALSEAFADAFGGRHAEADRALEAVRATTPHCGRLVTWIAREYRRAGDRAFAARLAEGAPPEGGDELGAELSASFESLAAARGDQVATDWLERQPMAPPVRELLEGYLLTGGHPAAAGRIAEADDESGEYGWLMRAAAWRLDGGRHDERESALRAHLASPDDGVYRPLVRYMLGDLDEPSVLALATTPKRRTEVWFWCGLRAWSEGRARDAVLWMVLCQEAGSERDGEFLWSASLLRDWCAAWRAPERLKRGTAPRA